MFTYTDAMADRITYVPVEWIMQSLTDSADSFYFSTYDEDEDNLIAALVQYKAPKCARHIVTIEREGFRFPIIINVGDGFFSMGNGHHRFTAAILLCLEEIPVYFATDSDFMHVEVSTSDGNDWESLPYNSDVDDLEPILCNMEW